VKNGNRKKTGRQTDVPEMSEVRLALEKTGNNIFQSVPVILSVLLLISLVLTLIPAAAVEKLFTGNRFLDPLIGSIAGSISSGTPLTSYIIGGELQRQGISLPAVTAFIVSWVTVGIVQFPAEALTLGKKFATVRNLLAFVSSILIAILTLLILE